EQLLVALVDGVYLALHGEKLGLRILGGHLRRALLRHRGDQAREERDCSAEESRWCAMKSDFLCRRARLVRARRPVVARPRVRARPRSGLPPTTHVDVAFPRAIVPPGSWHERCS